MSGDDELREPDQLDGVPLPETRLAVVGHAGPRSTVMTALDAARLPGGILLHGPRGIGKATLAFDIAREVFAGTGDESREHIAAQVAAGAYPNLRVLRKAPRDTGRGFYTQIRVEDVRDACLVACSEHAEHEEPGGSANGKQATPPSRRCYMQSRCT